MKRVRLTRLPLLFLIVALFTVFAPGVSADMGPKPELTVYVENPPQEPYYLDLLVQSPGGTSNLSEEERAALDENMLKELKVFEDQGWYPALLDGTKIPMWGELTGTPQGENMVHTFGYYGVPDTYRILIVTKSGTTVFSQICQRQSFQGTVRFDYAATLEAMRSGENPPTQYAGGGVRQPDHFWVYLIQFLGTFLPTLIIEGGVLLLFRFHLRENWKPLLFCNLATQLVLTVAMGAALIQQGMLAAYVVQAVVEVAILLFEMFVYGRYLKGHTRGRRLAYGAAANAASWAAGFVLSSAVYSPLFTRFL